MVKIAGIVFSTPRQYLLADNPFYFVDEFEKWFFYMSRTCFDKEYWFTSEEIPLDRCKL